MQKNVGSKRILLALLLVQFQIFVMCKPSMVSASPDCVVLYKYRDGQLVRDYDAAMARYRFSGEALQTLHGYKKELDDVAFWHVSPLGQMKDAVILVLRQTIDLILGTLQLNPETAAPARIADKAVTTVAYVRHQLELGRPISDVARDAITNKAEFNAQQSEGYPELKVSIKVLRKQIIDVKAIMQMGDEVEALRQIVANEMETIDARARQYQTNIARAENDIASVNDVRIAIDETCRPTPAPTPRATPAPANPLSGTWTSVSGGGTANDRYGDAFTLTVQKFSLAYNSSGTLTGGTLQATLTELRQGRVCSLCDHNTLYTYTVPVGARSSSLSFARTAGSSGISNIAASFSGTLAGGALVGTLSFSHAYNPTGRQWITAWSLNVGQRLSR